MARGSACLIFANQISFFLFFIIFFSFLFFLFQNSIFCLFGYVVGGRGVGGEGMTTHVGTGGTGMLSRGRLAQVAVKILAWI